MASNSTAVASLEAYLLATPNNGLVLTQYFEASAAVCAFYDHFLTLAQERRYIWGKKIGVVKVLYFVLRYGIEAGLVYLTYVFSGHAKNLDRNFNTLAIRCRNLIIVLWGFIIVFSGATHVYVIYHHYTLWDRRTGALIGLSIAFAATYIPATVLGWKLVIQYRKSVVHFEAFNVCLITEQSNFAKAMFTCMAAFDILAVLIAALNSFDKPYRRRSDVLDSLRRDGVIWFAILFAIRLANLFVNVTARPETVLIIAFHVWAFADIILSRLILRVEANLGAMSSNRIKVWNSRSQMFEMDPVTGQQSGTSFL